MRLGKNGREQVKAEEGAGTAYMTVREVAVAIGLSAPRTYALIADRELPAIRSGRRIRVPRAAFDRWLEQQAEIALTNVREPNLVGAG